MPAVGNRSETPLLTFALEAQPSLTEFTCDGHSPVERRLTPLWRDPALRSHRQAFAARCGGPAVGLSSLRRGGCDQPHLPPFARRVEKRPIVHGQVLRRCLRAKVCAQRFCFAGRVPQRANSATGYSIFPTQTYVVTRLLARFSQRVSSFLPASRWSKLSNALKTKK